jgi:hypothetical protein
MKINSQIKKSACEYTHEQLNKQFSIPIAAQIRDRLWFYFDPILDQLGDPGWEYFFSCRIEIN